MKKGTLLKIPIHLYNHIYCISKYYPIEYTFKSNLIGIEIRVSEDIQSEALN